MEIEVPVQVVRIKYRCDQCNIGTMQTDGPVYRRHIHHGIITYILIADTRSTFE